MNPKQTIPLIATLAPVAPVIAPVIPALLVGGAVFLVLKCLLSDNDTEKKPETVPANAETENRRKEAETALKTPAFRPIPTGILVKPAAVPVYSARAPVIAPPSPPVSPAPKISTPAPAPAPVIKSVVQTPPPPIKKKFVRREDLAAVFQRGARALTRTAAVAALKKLGFGKTAAYEALSPDGRFASWLQIVPDGIISWHG